MDNKPRVKRKMIVTHNTKLVYCNRAYYVFIHMLASIAVMMIIYSVLSIKGYMSPLILGNLEKYRLAELKVTEQQIKAEAELGRLKKENADEFKHTIGSK